MLAPFAPGGDAFHGDPARGADVLTNSWACPPYEGCDLGALRPAVDALTAAGLFVVAAAGNDGPRCGTVDDPPAPYAETFTVGAVDAGGYVAGFSSRGPAPGGGAKPDVAAPGVDVVSALPGGGYGALSGTSMATPAVAGVVALMWSADPALRGDVARTAQILRDTATPATGDGRCPTADEVGAGVVNAFGAVTAARAAGR
jgi:subtilisin family serine protease